MSGIEADRIEVRSSRNWTVRLRERIVRTVPRGQWLPDRQPAYVRSWIYVFGVACLAALIVVIASGIALAVEGAGWWHVSALGHFVNSVHLWSVELFFGFMVVHLWGKFFMAAWRGKRALTWITGAIAFVGSIGTAFTGYLSQSNFDSQWIAGQAKDGLNAVGIGSRFNVLNSGQMLLFHVSLLPLIIGVLVVLHIVLVRRHGVVPPFDAEPADYLRTEVRLPSPEPAVLAITPPDQHEIPTPREAVAPVIGSAS
ncbi:ubiquinol-cytochrome c reductase cytochrome b subunit [Nakamurella sp. UYEF19]|uniref:cytochrome b N-terminal domain-containing protein n=1 Tax=Nakamurella sp. UYEF19 TaxID=1756392 RepID=UPI003390F4D7